MNLKEKFQNGKHIPIFAVTDGNRASALANRKHLSKNYDDTTTRR